MRLELCIQTIYQANIQANTNKSIAPKTIPPTVPHTNPGRRLNSEWCNVTFAPVKNVP